VVAIRLVGAAQARGLRTVAWLPGEGPAANEIDRLGVRRRGYDLDALKGTAAARLVSCARVAVALLASRRPIVHVHNPVVFGMLRPALQAARARAVVHFQIEASPGEIEWTLESPPAHIIACAKYIAAAVADAARRRDLEVPVSAVPNAVDLDRFVPGDREAARARLGMGSGRFVVLMLANLAPHKGQATTLKAVRSLVDRGVPVECWLVGEDREKGGRYGQELRSLAGSLGLADTVRFLGFRQDGPVLLQAADAFVLPSTHEGLPLSVLEAQACRVPVVGSDIPGILEVVDDGKTGFVVPAGDHEGYADRLAALSRSAPLRDHVTEAAWRQATGDYSFSKLEERVFSIYDSVAAR
jgi:glycosyltransferase involved in cell wall biosynthesis